MVKLKKSEKQKLIHSDNPELSLKQALGHLLGTNCE